MKRMCALPHSSFRVHRSAFIVHPPSSFPMTLPDNWQELLAGYILGDLDPEEAERVRQLLSMNPDLAVEADRLQEVLGA
jgi:hypothetical protein